MGVPDGSSQLYSRYLGNRGRPKETAAGRRGSARLAKERSQSVVRTAIYRANWRISKKLISSDLSEVV